MKMIRHASVLGLILVLFGSLVSLANASASLTIPEVGVHTPLLKFEKNENPQNLMIVYTKLNSVSCAFEAKDAVPLLDEYWLMDGANYKRVHPMIKNSVQQRLQVDKEAFVKSKQFLVHLKDFRELKSDLGESPVLEVKAKKVAASCEAFVEMNLGPSDKGRRIEVSSIFADSSKKLLPPFRRLRSITLVGKDVATGEAVRRTYQAR